MRELHHLGSVPIVIQQMNQFPQDASRLHDTHGDEYPRSWVNYDQIYGFPQISEIAMLVQIGNSEK